MPWRTEEPNGICEASVVKHSAPNHPSPARCRMVREDRVSFSRVPEYSRPRGQGLYYDKNGNLLSVEEYDCLPASCTAFPRIRRGASGTAGGLPLARTPSTPTGLHSGSHHHPVSNEANAYWDWTAPRLLNAKKTSKVTGSVSAYSEFTYDADTGRGN